MRVADIMSKHVRGVTASVDAESAWRIMQEARIRHLVVLDGDDVIGILSERDLGGVHGVALRDRHSVRDLMTPCALVLEPDADALAVSKAMRGLVIGCFPVVANKQLVGIVTTSDLLDVIATTAKTSR